MAKLRHIAIQVPDLEKAAAFYERVFGLTRLKKVEAPIGNAISLSDGVMNLTLLHFPEGTKGGKGPPDWAGLHHFGFVVEKFNLFVLTLARSLVGDQHTAQLQRLSGGVSQYEGLAFITCGLLLIVLATVRFMRTDPGPASARPGAFHPHRCRQRRGGRTRPLPVPPTMMNPSASRSDRIKMS